MASEVEEIEAILNEELHILPDEQDGKYPILVGVKQAARAIAALRAQDREGARPDIVEALKREAQEQKFRRDLADSTYASLKERLCRAAHLVFAGNDRALRRLVDTIENPKPIYGSAALPLSPVRMEDGDA